MEFKGKTIFLKGIAKLAVYNHRVVRPTVISGQEALYDEMNLGFEITCFKRPTDLLFVTVISCTNKAFYHYSKMFSCLVVMLRNRSS